MSTATTPTLWQRLRYTRLRDAMRGRFDASLDWRQIIADAELPPAIANTIDGTVQRTRLWKGEKVDVARELVAHFQDGLDAGRTAEQLVDSFGDSAVAARLIRRAKKRGRPVLWHALRWSSITIAALAFVYFLVSLYMMTGRPSIKIDYLARFNERPSAVPEADRAWPLYRDTLLAMGIKGKEGDSEPTRMIPGGDARPGDADWPKLEQFLRDHADSIPRLRAAAAKPDLGFVTSTSFAAFSPQDLELFGVTVSDEESAAFKTRTLEDRWLISTLLPYLQQLRGAALILAGDARRAALAGDAETSMADIVAMLGVSRHVQEPPFLVNILVANAIHSNAWQLIRDILKTNPQLWSDAQLRDLAHRIAASPIDWRRGFDGESACFDDIMQRFYTDDGHGDGRLAFRSSPHQNVFELLASLTSTSGEGASSLYAQDGLAMLVMPAANMVLASRKEMTEAYHGFMNTAVAKIGLPLCEQDDVPLPNEELLSDRAGPIDRYRYVFIRILVPAYQVVWNRIATADGQRDGVLVGLALELYHREHGAWPKELAELSPRWIPKVPADRITGRPLGYKIIDDRPVVYSAGADTDDDGGRIPLDDDDKFDPELASPMHFNSNAEGNAEGKDARDGDWIIWSTAKVE